MTGVLLWHPRRPPWKACVHFRDSYPIDVSHLSLNFLCLLLLEICISLTASAQLLYSCHQKNGSWYTRALTWLASESSCKGWLSTNATLQLLELADGGSWAAPAWAADAACPLQRQYVSWARRRRGRIVCPKLLWLMAIALRCSSFVFKRIDGVHFF
jgi:hypothetical protein